LMKLIIPISNIQTSTFEPWNSKCLKRER